MGLYEAPLRAEIVTAFPIARRFLDPDPEGVLDFTFQLGKLLAQL
jgi:hypothetical protein